MKKPLALIAAALAFLALDRLDPHLADRLLRDSLVKDFGIDKPKIAVLGLNPHSGDNGQIGTEEQTVIKPLIEQLQQQGQLVFGPFGADAFFARSSYMQFDAVLAMYHDQGLIPFKTIAFGTGVNFSAGLKIVRTSPDHGTGYKIAGKNQANELSMREAIFTAGEIFRHHAEQSKEK